MSRRQIKVFRCSSFSKMLPRCGRVAHICGANLFLRIVFPAAIAFFEPFQFAILWFIWNKLQIRTRQRGDCGTLAGKSRGGTPFCRMLKTVFPKSRIFCKVIFRCNCSPGTVTRYMFLIQVSQGGAVLFASKSCRFSHHPLRVSKAWHRDFAACGLF